MQLTPTQLDGLPVDLPATRGELETVLADRDLVEDPPAAVAATIDAEVLVPVGESTFGPEYGLAETGSEDETPGVEASETTRQDADSRGPLTDGVAKVAGEHYPPKIVEKDVWVSWILDGVGRKRPVAPWATGHAYPVKWGEDADDRPETEFDRAKRWAEFPLNDLGLSLPDDAQSDQLETGIILPHDRPPLEERFTLIDWDDVRDPETGEIHPVAAEHITEYGGYVEVSTSGEGLHQYVTGGLRKRGKFIAPIDEEPFVGDDLPQVEIYDGGRHVAMTGRFVEGADRDAVEGQELIDAIVREYAEAEKDAGHRRYDPETGEDAGGAEDAEGGATVPDPVTGEYTGPPLETLRDTQPTDRPLRYHAVVYAFYTGGGNSDGYANILNWRLEGVAAALAEQADLDLETVKADLGGEYLDDTEATKRAEHRTPHRVEYAYNRAAKDRLKAPSTETLAEQYGVLPPAVLETDDEGDTEDDGEDYRRDPREVEATVDIRRAWEAAARVEADDLEVIPPALDEVDVVRAVAAAEGLVDTVEDPIADAYPEAYRLAREEYGAPLPKYYTTADAIAEFDAVLDVLGEVTYWDLDTEALATEVTVADPDDVGGEAVRALNPAWRDSTTGESVLVFESGTVWDADTETTVDPVRFAALDRGLVDDPTDPVRGETFLEAYRVLREELGAPLPRWDPAADGDRDHTPMLPDAEELVDAPDVAAVEDRLETAREEVEALVRDTAANADGATVITALPALGKTTGTIKTAGETPLSYLTPRKDLQADAVETAAEFGVEYEVLPVFAEAGVDDEALEAAEAIVREDGEHHLRRPWQFLEAVTDRAGVDAEELIYAGDDDVDLDRPTCPTADGDHGDAWALITHTARELGYTPRQIHQHAEGLFGRPLPCDGACEYGDAWDRVTDHDDPADLFIGSYTHAHIQSVGEFRTRNANGDRVADDRPIVLDEFPGGRFTREFGGEARKFAAWLAGCLREDVADETDMLQADLWGDEFVRAWLDGEAGALEAVRPAVSTLEAVAGRSAAETAAETILEEVDRDVLEELGVFDALEAVLDGVTPTPEAHKQVSAAVESADPRHPAANIVDWVADAVLAELPETEPDLDAVTVDAPIGGDLAQLIATAVEAVREDDETAEAKVEAATRALKGGRDGCETLAAWADAGYAHPEAYQFLEAVATPTGEGEVGDRVELTAKTFDAERDATVVDRVETGETSVVVLDRNGEGALLHTAPNPSAPIVGLDATARAELWANVLRKDVALRDIHDTDAERAAFLEEVLDLSVIQAAEAPRFYEGDPTTKDTEGDVALLEAIAEEYAGVRGPRDREETAAVVGDTVAAITSKGVRGVLEDDDRLADVVDTWAHYGDVAGRNDLAAATLAGVLGTQHYGDQAVEEFAVLDGREVETGRDTRGAELSYGDALADEYLAHMTEDQTMQAILRFARGDTGATVVARTGALREDLPIVGEGQVVETWSDTATTIAREWRRLGGRFTVDDVVDAVDVGRRQVRRVLEEFAGLGYVEIDREGRRNTYTPTGSPDTGEVDLEATAELGAGEPGRDLSNNTYTWHVRVAPGANGGDRARPPSRRGSAGAPPAPPAVAGAEPPG